MFIFNSVDMIALHFGKAFFQKVHDLFFLHLKEKTSYYYCGKRQAKNSQTHDDSNFHSFNERHGYKCYSSYRRTIENGY